MNAATKPAFFRTIVMKGGISMKKFIRMISFILILLFLVSGCSIGKTFTGDMWGYISSENCYIICDGNGKEYGFYVTNETELVWNGITGISTREMESENWDKYQWDWLIGSCKVKIAAGEKAEPYDGTGFDEVAEWYYAKKITVLERYEEIVDEKPVIYLYPEEKTEVTVNLDLDGRLTASYPKYNEGWKVTALPDGTLFDENGKEYYCLYWEGTSGGEYDFSKGFCVAGDETADFLENALQKLGLSRREANEFIVYWLPRMEQNEYNLIAFQGGAYTDSAKLEIDPQPDTLIRVFMAWKPLEEYCEIEPQELSAPERAGFAAVEWGGAKVK